MTPFYFLPTHLISKTIGFLTNLPAPQFIWQPIIRLYASFYNVNLAEAEYPISAYKTLGQFFTRNLKQNARPLGAGTLSPVDGVLRNYGKITGSFLPQIKGKHYSIDDLVGDSTTVASLKGGAFFNLYLSPRDYHHVHSPVEGVVQSVRYIPGRLFPVNDASMGSVKNLFGRNERVTFTLLDSHNRTVVLTMVGALNVGKISLAFDSDLSRRITDGCGKGFAHRYGDSTPAIARGARLGTFHFGSSVALLFPSNYLDVPELELTPRSILMGESLEALCQTKRG